MDLLRLVLFVVLSFGVVLASSHAWRAKEIYGLTRFFAFETLVVLIVRNLGEWFTDPWSPRQITSWIIFLASTALAAHGFQLLRSVGRARERMIEDTCFVVEIGVYRYIRHPLYASLMFFTWGVFLKDVDGVSGLFAAATTVLLFATARFEEAHNLERFGVAYSQYMKRTKMFIPFVM